MTGYKSPPAKRSTIRVQPQYTNLERLAARYATGMTWKALGAEIGVSAATVRRAVVLGLYPANNKDRAALGVPLVGTAELCPVHGKVCAVKHRAATAPRKPRRPSRKAQSRAHMSQRMAWKAEWWS